MEFWKPFSEIGITLLVALCAGIVTVGVVLPRDRAFLAERVGWAIVLGLALVATLEAARLAASAGPSPWPLWAAVFVILISSNFWAARPLLDWNGLLPRPGRTAVQWLLLAVVAAAVLLYAVMSLAEPMWSNDFVAIWGLKGKAIALSPDGRFPAWLSDPEIAGSSHPEYPLGLPLLFAGLARLAGVWDDQALAVLYPVLLVATLHVLYGWLRRRGASATLALAAAALVALFEPLYSGFLTGMAEVPVSLAILLIGISLSDALDATDPMATRRLAVASFLAASVKNEGLFVAVAAGGIALFSAGDRRRRIFLVAAAIVPAVGPAVLGRVFRGAPPLRDFDFGLFAPGRWSELAGRLVRGLVEDARLAAGAIPVLAAVAILFACGRRTRWADRPLLLGLVAVAAYLTLPAFAVRGPEWLADTTLARTAAALVPLAAAGLAGRLAAVFPPPPLLSAPDGSSGS